MDYTKIHEITEPYSKEFTELGNLYDNDAISKAFLKDARKLYSSAYIKEVKAFLLVAWLEEKQRLWVERYRVRTSSEEKRKELKREYTEKRAEFKRQKASDKAAKFANKFVEFIKDLCRKHKKSEKTEDVPDANSQIQCDNSATVDAIAPALTSADHSTSEQNTDVGK